jgi:hypothetical protein
MLQLGSYTILNDGFMANSTIESNSMLGVVINYIHTLSKPAAPANTVVRASMMTSLTGSLANPKIASYYIAFLFWQIMSPSKDA